MCHPQSHPLEDVCRSESLRTETSSFRLHARTSSRPIVRSRSLRSRDKLLSRVDRSPRSQKKMLMKQQPARQPGLSSRLVQRTQHPRRARVDWQPRPRIKTLWISQAVRPLGRSRRLGQRAWNLRAPGMDRRPLLRRKMPSNQQAAGPPSRTSSGAEERARHPRRRRMTVGRVRGRATFPAALTFGPTILEAKATGTIAVAGNRAGRRLTVTEPRKVGS